MIPKFRAWGVERYPGLKQPASKMHRNVSVVTTYPEGITFILTNFIMQGDDEYSGSIIDDAILMQSTGLKDKNGKEIFEGDVVQFEDCSEASDFLYINTGIIEWCQGGFHVTNRDSVLMEDLLDGDSLDVTIIGNIYENRELLEDK